MKYVRDEQSLNSPPRRSYPSRRKSCATTPRDGQRGARNSITASSRSLKGSSVGLGDHCRKRGHWALLQSDEGPYTKDLWSKPPLTHRSPTSREHPYLTLYLSSTGNPKTLTIANPHHLIFFAVIAEDRRRGCARVAGR
jgi:hypothetical protein